MLTQDVKEQIKEVRRALASHAISVNWAVQNLGAGAHPSRRVGDGDEFERHDEYNPLEDDPKSIDGIASAQTGGQPMYKRVFRETQRLNMCLLVDVSPSTHFGTTRVSKNFVAAHCAASAMHAAQENNDLVSVVSFSQQRIESRRSMERASEAFVPVLADILTPRLNTHKRSRWQEFLSHIPFFGRFFRNSLPAPAADVQQSGLLQALKSLPARKTVVFVISDFLTLSADEKRALKLAAASHRLVCIAIQDLRERQLSQGSGSMILEDMETGRRVDTWLSAENRQNYSHNFSQVQSSLATFFKSIHCNWLTVSTEEGKSAIPKIIALFAAVR